MKNIELRRGLVPEQHSGTKTRIETIRSGNSEAEREVATSDAYVS